MVRWAEGRQAWKASSQARCQELLVALGSIAGDDSPGPGQVLARAGEHPMARVSALWLGVHGGPMTASGIYQMIERRGQEAGVEVNPHKFRHTFSHSWLDNGGAEGDLMELNGWSSPQMLARYGRSARSARARRHYDDVMGG